jgi:hypothetical protein
MQYLILDPKNIKIIFSKKEAAMLNIALAGPAFDEDAYHRVRNLENWDESKTKKFDDFFSKEWRATQKTHINISLSKEELSFLIAIHEDAMEELGLQEYPCITGYSIDEAEDFFKKLLLILREFDRTDP